MVGPSEAHDTLAVCDDAILTLPQRRGLAARSRPSVPEAVIGPRGRPLSTPASGWIGTRRLRGRLCPSLSNPGSNDRGPLELHGYPAERGVISTPPCPTLR